MTSRGHTKMANRELLPLNYMQLISHAFMYFEIYINMRYNNVRYCLYLVTPYSNYDTWTHCGYITKINPYDTQSSNKPDMTT